MYITTTGLVLRETNYKETSKILTVLTAAEGKITVSARGTKRRGSKTAAATQLLAFSEMTLFLNRGRWTITEAQSIELFSELRADIELLSLGAYFAEMLEAVSDEDFSNPEVLALGLNALYSLSEGKKSPVLIKTAFETRLMCLAGFAPMVSACGICGKRELKDPVLSIYGGTIFCRSCKSEITGTCVPLCPGSVETLRYITDCESKKVFSFKLGDEALKRMAQVSEMYVQAQLERSFRTLDFYKSVKL